MAEGAFEPAKLSRCAQLTKLKVTITTLSCDDHDVYSCAACALTCHSDCEGPFVTGKCACSKTNNPCHKKSSRKKKCLKEGTKVFNYIDRRHSFIMQLET